VTAGDERIARVAEGWHAYATGGADAVLTYLDPEIEIYAAPDGSSARTCSMSRPSVSAAWWSRCGRSPAGGSRASSSSGQVVWVHELRDDKVVYMGLFADRDAARAAAAEREPD
jgi:hypothetical protein